MSRRNQKPAARSDRGRDNSATTCTVGLSDRVGNIEEVLKDGIETLKTQILNGAGDPETLNTIAIKLEDFKTTTLESLQVFKNDLLKLETRVGAVENRADDHRRELYLNDLVVYGIEESDGEDLVAVAANVINSKILKISRHKMEFSECDINYCYRLGRKGEGGKKPRPLSVSFTNRWKRDTVFGLKRHLKGSGVVVSERLTVSALKLYTQARVKLGTKSCWTQGGKVYVCVGDIRKKIVDEGGIDDLCKDVKRDG